MSLLGDFDWKSKYDSDGERLERQFYEPVLRCAVQYDRTTGYFCASVLMLASRGIEALVRNVGRMRLIVGCTLDAPEVDAIERGEELRDQVATRLAVSMLDAATASEQDALELLSWMVAHGYLEVKVAIPCGADRRPIVSNAIFHEKAGIVYDKTGARLAFSGSVNETHQGWTGNWESFHVFTDDSAKTHVDAEVASFTKLWKDEAKHCRVLDLPTAIKDDLLRFLPPDDTRPRRLIAALESVIPKDEESTVDLPPDVEVDTRRLVWGVIRHAPAGAPGGARVGEATAAVEPWPHQVRTFERLYDSWPPRLLIADEVGLGKTIEAGLLLRQAWLAERARRILVLAPKSLLRQWQIELREKFNLSWPIYDGRALRWYESRVLAGRVERLAGPDEWHQEPCVLASSQLMRRADRTAELLESAQPYDLILLDEAHHARRSGGGANRDRVPNRLLALMEALRIRTKGLVLLTATPMQVDPGEIWDLLKLLGLPPEWDEASFRSFFERASSQSPSHEDFEFMARLFRATEASLGEVRLEDVRRLAPDLGQLTVKKVLRALRDKAQMPRKRLESEERRAALRILRKTTPVGRMISRHTRELLRQYRKAGKLDARIAERDVHDEFVPMSPVERDLYEAVESYISNAYQRASDAERNAVGFVMTTYRRRLASSFVALEHTLQTRLQSLSSSEGFDDVNDEDILEEPAADEPMDADEAAEYQLFAQRVEETDEIRLLLDRVRALPTDTKAQTLLAALRTLLSQGYPQVMVFTQYTDTLDFLRNELAGKHGFSVLCFSGRGGEALRGGRWQRISRDDTKRGFKNREAQVLLCTDAAAEGLNFQFCGALVNYDMPWNPMRVEQRIGRIDRLGQDFEKIRIINLHYEDTVETDVYRVLRQRIGLFSKYVGKLQPILASLPRQLAEAVLSGGSNSDRSRSTFVDHLEETLKGTEESGFDLDEVTAADLELPTRAPAAYDLDDLDALLLRADLLPPGVEVRRLDPQQYAVRMPGMRSDLRVTTSPDVFDEHPDSVELWSPGSPIFPVFEDAAAAEVVAREPRRLSELLLRK